MSNFFFKPPPPPQQQILYIFACFSNLAFGISAVNSILFIFIFVLYSGSGRCVSFCVCVCSIDMKLWSYFNMRIHWRSLGLTITSQNMTFKWRKWKLCFQPHWSVKCFPPLKIYLYCVFGLYTIPIHSPNTIDGTQNTEHGTSRNIEIISFSEPYSIFHQWTVDSHRVNVPSLTPMPPAWLQYECQKYIIVIKHFQMGNQVKNKKKQLYVWIL